MTDQYSFNQIGDIASEKNRTISLPVFLLPPGFYTAQLFCIGLSYQNNGNTFLCNQNPEAIDKFNITDNIDLNKEFNGIENTVNRTNNFINLLKSFSTKDSSEENGNPPEIFHFEDQLFDRNPDLFHFLNKYQKSFAFLLPIKFINLDKKKHDYIYRKLSSVDLSNPSTFLFYSKKGISSKKVFDQFPFKVLVQKSYGLQQNSEKIKEKFGKKFKRYVENTFIIGSFKRGIPALIIINDECAIKIYDNNTEHLSNFNDIYNSLETVYMLYYSINCGINTKLEVFKTNPKKATHSKIIESTDTLLKDFIQYKIDTFWKNKQFNLLDLIAESIKYPAFFGYCCGFSNEICHCGSIVLAADDDSFNPIADSSTTDTKTKLTSFRNSYRSFSTFCLYFIYFLKEILTNPKCSDLDNYAKSFFKVMPQENNILFDLLVDFIEKIIAERDLLSANMTRNLIEYLYLTVENQNALRNQLSNFASQPFNQVFDVKDMPSITVNAFLEDLNELRNSDNFKGNWISMKIEVNEIYQPKFIKPRDYIEFLGGEIEPKIHL